MFNLTIKNILSSKSSLEKELILAHAIKRDRVFVITRPDFLLTPLQYLHFKYYNYLLHRGYSVAAITKHKEFFGLDFFVNKNVLIPRPETELLVAEAIQEISTSQNNTLLIDVGTGSGCIPIAIVKNISPKTKAIAIDISSLALRVAKKNIKKHQVNIELIKSNLLNSISHRNFNNFNNIIITANLPYLTDKQVKNESSIRKEPKLALIAEENGLDLYRKLLTQTANIFHHKPTTLFFEIDPDQKISIKNLIKEYFPSANIEIKKDLAGQDRLVKIST